jgi:hypothetical protein
MHYRSIYLAALATCTLSAIVLLSSCKKDEEEETPIICGLPNGTLKWKENGVEKCANVSLFADYTIDMTVSGISAQGPTFTLELDSLNVGTYALTADYNYMLYTDGLALAWEATNEQPGSITITSHNESTNRLEATFQINLVSPISGATKQITDGQLSITYTE